MSCVFVCYGEIAASISSLANWCMVLCIYIYICKCTYKDTVVWVCCIHPAKLRTLWVIDFMLSGLSLLCCSPFRRLAAVRIEGIKGEVTVMSKAACFLLSQLRTSTSTGQVRLRSVVRPLPDSTLTPRWTRWQNSKNTLHRGLWRVMTPGQGGGD